MEYYINSWLVELHGTLRTNLSRRIDIVLDKVQDNVFCCGNVRSWDNNGIIVFLPSPDNDIVFIFTHILQHFFEGGIGLKQLCDLARLLWSYKYEINHNILKQRLKSMGVLSEWKAFGCVLVNILGLPRDAMPLYDDAYSKKAQKIFDYILESGNFGQNKDYSFFTKYPALIRKMITLWRQTKDSIRLMRIFPIDSFVFLIRFIISGFKAAIVGD